MHKLPDSPPARHLVILSFVALAFFALRTISNTDFWIHLATGRHIAEIGRPLTDPFAFSLAQNQIWTNPAWLYDLALYQVWQLGGAPLVSLAFMACILAAFAAVRPLARQSAADTPQALALLAVAWLIAPALSIGPHGPALLCAALFIRVLAVKQTRAALWTLIPAQILWTNIHGSFLLGPGLALLFWIESRREGNARLAPWLPLAVLAATLVNPQGIRIHQLAVAGLINPNAVALLEWISPFQPDFAPFAARHIHSLLLAIVASGFITVSGRLRLSTTALGVLGAFLLVLTPRGFLFSGLLLFPFAATSLQGLGQWISLRAGGAWFPAGRSLLAGFTALTMLMVCSNFYYNRTGSASTFGLGVAEDLFPGHASDTILSHPEFPARMLHLAQDGGYLAWRFPDRKIFVDSRTSIYGLEFYQRLGRGLMGQPEAWTELMDRHDPGAIILNGAWPGAGAAALRLIDAGEWALAYMDGTTVVLLRRTQENNRLLHDFEFQRAGLQRLEAARKAGHREADSWLPARNNPRLIGAGLVYFSFLRFAEAEEVLDVVSRMSPTYTTGWQNLGISQMQRGKVNEAIRTLKKSCAMRKNSILSWFWLGKAYEANGQPADAEAALRKARKINPGAVHALENGGAQSASPTSAVPARAP